MGADVRGGLRWAIMGVVCFVAGLLVWNARPSAVGLTLAGNTVSAGPSPTSTIGDSLVLPSMQWLDAGQQVAAEERARSANPEVRFARERSRTAYEHLGTNAAAILARKSFPEMVDRTSGDMGWLPKKARIEHYASTTAAQLDLPDGQKGVVESLTPIARRTGDGRFTPIDLSLSDVGDAYTPASSNVAVWIPKRLDRGVQLSEAGISIAPVDARGARLIGSPGALDGSSVFYANTQTDTDTVVKPTKAGFDIDTMLRSSVSPRKLYYRIGMPAGERLVQSVKSGSVGIVDDGRIIATLPTPVARDAAGTVILLKASVAAGNILELSVANSLNEYQYPIDVDPEIVYQNNSDVEVGIPSTGRPTNWEFHRSRGGSFAEGTTSSTETGISEAGEAEKNVYPTGIYNGLSIYATGNYYGGEYAYLDYKTKGVSKVYGIDASVEGLNSGANIESYFEFEGPPPGGEKGAEEGEKGTPEVKLQLSISSNYARKETLFCVSSCNESAGAQGNLIRFEQAATGNGSSFTDKLYAANVLVAQPSGTHPTVTYDTANEHIANGWENILYGSGGWIGERSGAVEFTAKDAGIGVSGAKVEYDNKGTWETVNEHNYVESNDCRGIQCYPEVSESFTYNKKFAEGKDTIRVKARDLMAENWSSSTEGERVIQVDNTPPREIKLRGISETGAEISAAPHQITIEATDGTAPTPSSGIKSISVLVDGSEIGSPAGSCAPGECTAGGTWTINGETLGTGEHKLLVVASDNAGNITKKEYTFAVRSATPVSVGPGSVDPVTGQLTLKATDVDITGVGGVSRTYASRSPSANLESPLGRQWSLSVGSGESLKVLPNGSVELIGAGGGKITFASNGSGKLISPKGDGNLTLEAKEAEVGKGVTEYLLQEPANGTKTTFKQPSGGETPTYSLEVGSIGGNGGQFEFPEGMTADAKGNIWVADRLNNRVDELNEAGAFISAFGYGVANGEEKLETCTSLCQAGIMGAGNGQFHYPNSVAIDAKGDIWVSDNQNSRIEEFNEKEEYLKQFGISGSGGSDIAGYLALDGKGNIWVDDWSHDSVYKYSEAGMLIESIGYGVTNGEDKFQICTAKCEAGIAGSGNGQFSSPYSIDVDSKGNLWVADTGNNRVEKFNEKGEYLGQFGTKGSGAGQLENPYSVAIDAKGNIWVTDGKPGYVEEFNEKFEYVTKFGTKGTGTGEFTLPYGLAITQNGNIWVSDWGRSQIQKWTRQAWVPISTEGPTSGDTYKYTYRSVVVEGKAYAEPTEVLGPVPAGVSCTTKLEKGCRALSFTYSSATTAKGESASEWGEVNGLLAKVSFTAYNPSTGTMQTTAVAQYLYDKSGRLRTEWDPRISPALKTTYAYDAEGHVTAVSPPGQQPWLIHYGIIAGDSNAGRTLSVTRPGATTSLGNGSPPAGTPTPMLSSTSPVIGTTLSVSSNGSWSNSPLAYSYQWEDCNVEGKECSRIVGALNQSYTPQAGDAGYTLVAQVAAQNSTGSATAVTAASKVIAMPVSTYSTVFGKGGTGSGELGEPVGLAEDAGGNIWVAENHNKRFSEFSSSGTFIAAYGWGVLDGKEELEKCTTTCRAGLSGTHNGEFMAPEGIAVSPTTGNIYVSDYIEDRVQEFTPAGAFVTAFGSVGTGGGQLEEPRGIKVDSSGDVWVSDFGNGRIEEFTSAGTFMKVVGSPGSGEGQLGLPAEITFSGGNIYVTDYKYDRVDEFSPTGTFLRRFGSEGTGSGQFEHPWGIATDPYSGDIYVVDEGNTRVAEYNEVGTLLATFGAKGTGNGQFSDPDGVVVGLSGNVYVDDRASNRVEKWLPGYSTNNPAPTPPTPGSNAIWTLEYHVPVSGTGAPLNMSSAELATWGQTEDLPSEGMAMFPPDEPMGWPAADYKRAALDYLDVRGRSVDTASPGGAIGVTEYNSMNEVTRALTPDNRASALKEGSKSAEVAKLLSTENIYNGEGTQLVESYRPEHKIKLANGAEVETHDRKKFSYDEGEPSGEEHDLMTKVREWTEETSSKKVVEEHETDVSYSGQQNGKESLGWKLRRPTSVTSEANGQKTTDTTTYEPETGEVKETSTSTSSHPAAYAFEFGSYGTGEGQFRSPMSEAFDGSGNLWVVDSGNDRVEEFSASGTLIRKFGTEGTGGGQFKSPWGIAINKSTGNVYVSDVTNNRVEEFSSGGTFLRTWGFDVNSGGKEVFEVCTSGCVAGKSGAGEGQFNKPQGIAVDATGNVWVVDEQNSRVEKFGEEGKYLSKFGSHGAENGQMHEPAGIAISDGNLYVAEYANSRVQEFSFSGVYINQFGSKGTGSGQFEGAEGIAVDPVSGDLYVTDDGNSRVEQFSAAGVFLDAFGIKGSGNGQLNEPEGIAVNAVGAIFVADTKNNRVSIWEPIPQAPAYTAEFGSGGKGNGQFNHPMMDAVDSSGNVWVADGYNSRIEKFSSSGTYLGTYGEPGSSETELQFNEPVGIAINSKTGKIYVGDQNNNRVVELSSSGKLERVFGKAGTGAGEFKEADGIAIDSNGNVWVTDYSDNRVEEFNETGTFIRIFGFGVKTGKNELEVCTSACRAGIAGSGSGQFTHPADIAIFGEDIYVTDLGNSRIEEFERGGETFVRAWGSPGAASGDFNAPSGITTDTNGNVYVADSGNARVQEFSPAGTYLTQFGTKGSGSSEMAEPEGVAVTSAGSMYVTDAGSNNRVQEWVPAPRPGNEAAKNSRTIYYTSAANSEYPGCGGHPEWGSLPCLTEPDVQPGVAGTPELPITVTTYNIWDSPETVTEIFGEKVGAVTRTTKRTFDGAGRVVSSEESSTSAVDDSLPTVTDEYSPETGTMVKQSEVLSGKTKAVSSVYNTLGQLTSYTDGEGVTAKYTYDVDGRVSEVDDGKESGSGSEVGSQSYAYDPTTGRLTKLLDSGAHTFTATYDAEGRLLTEGYPNGMTEKYTYNSLGQPTNLEYEKTTHCTEKCLLFSDSDVYGANGQLASQVSTLSSERYRYDEAERLTETEEFAPSGKECTDRLYEYNEESERTGSETGVNKPNSKGECPLEGGVLEGHFYDAIGRLLDPGVTYDPFGNMTKVLSVDAGGSEMISSFYVDNQVASQAQGGDTIEYQYDPAGRPLETTSKKSGVTSMMVSNYAGPGDALSWTSEEKGKKFIRYIPGIDGVLDATETNGEAPTLMLHDLQGNVVGAAALSETVTELMWTHNSTEFGVPAGTAPTYSWLGAEGASSELGTGVITSGGATYVPQLARTLQTESITPAGAMPNGSGSGAPYTSELPTWAIEGGAASGAGAPGREAERMKTLENEEESAIQKGLEEAGEGEDPTYYYNGFEAEKLGKKLEEANKIGQVASLLNIPDDLFDALEKLAEVVMEKLYRVKDPLDWSGAAGKALVECAEDATNRCKFKFSEIKFEVKWWDPILMQWEYFSIKFANVLDPAEVFWCLGGTAQHPNFCSSNPIKS
jgi:tripartite motif-containing protein 71